MDKKPHKEVVFAPEAHEEMLKGATILNNAVKSTIGPCGHCVIIQQPNGIPVLTKDGVTVARSINLKDPLYAVGANLLKEVAQKTNELAGDGTTSSVILAHSILTETLKMIATGRSSIYLKKGMDIAVEEVINFLKENCIPISSTEDVINVGTISANGDRTIGQLISNAIEKVGKDGIVTIEPAKSVQTSLEFVEGMRLDNGYLSPFFITNSEKGTCELEEPCVLITPNKISSMGEIISVLESVARNSKSLLIIADDVEGEALHTLIVNKTKGVLKVCAVKAPSYGEFRADILSDLSVLLGGNVFGATSDISLKNANIDHLGSCKRIIVGRNHTTIIGNSNEERLNALEERVKSLRTLLTEDKTLDALHIDKYRTRLAYLSGGIAIIKVGGSTEVEINEKKDRVEDAVNATLAATQEGVVPGGGSALFYAAEHLRYMLKEKDLKSKIDNDDIIAGIEIVAKVCEAPFNTIIENTGNFPAVVAEHMRSFKENKDYTNLGNGNILSQVKTDSDKAVAKWFSFIRGMEAFRYGYNSSTGKYGDLIKEGILDPVKVTKHALMNAISVVGLMITSNTVILNDDEGE